MTSPPRVLPWQSVLFASGRVGLGAVFAATAMSMWADYAGTLASLQDATIDVHGLVPAAIALQLAAGTAIIFGLLTRPASLAIAAYLVLELVVLPPDLGLDLGRAVLFAHAGLLAALAMLAANGPGRLSVDRAFALRRATRAAAPAPAQNLRATR